MVAATKDLWLRLIAWGAGALLGLLVARLVARLLAARPDNGAVTLLYQLSAPLVTPLARLDAGQPRFGAVFELSTLALIMLVVLVGYGARRGRAAVRERKKANGRIW